MKFFLILLFLLSACGKSPILNHENEGTPGGLSGVQAQSAAAFPAAGLWLDVLWSSGPVVFDECQAVLIFRNKAGKLSDPPLTPRFWPWMPDHGHGTSPVVIEKVAPGTYHLKDIFFIMPGFWQLHIEVGEEEKLIDISL